MKSKLIALVGMLREPAWWVHAAGVAAVILVTVFPHLSTQAQAWWDAVISAVAGVVVAFLTRDGQFAAILGFVKAALLVMLGYGWMPLPGHLTPDKLAVVYTVLAGLTAAYTRTQAIAPVPPEPAPIAPAGAVAPSP